jgi:tRNA A-37 threonylcarbamoyl transferase component Bud32
MPITTAEEFFSVLEKSNLLTADRLAEVRRGISGGEDATSLARTLARDGLLTRWQAGQLLAGRRVFFLGKYKLIDFLGHGGMGSVFLAEHTMMNRRVALKVISKQIGEDPASLDRFLAEARTIAALDHPNIVQAYSVDNEGSQYYIVMEFIDGVDLQRLVETEGRMDYERAVDYVRQAAEGLSHAHQRNMVHCDIKPSNLLVNRQGVVKILDMGLARAVGHQAEQAAGPEEAVLGSVDYLAPEQAIASRDFDHRADIYALGCTLYFLLTGHPPFPEGTLPQRILKHQTQQPPSIRQQRPEAPADLVQICEKMMAKKPEDRFQTAEELSRLLGQWRPPVRQLRPAEPPRRLEPRPEASQQSWLAGELGEGAVQPAARAAAPQGVAPPSSSGAFRAAELAKAAAASQPPQRFPAERLPAETDRRKLVAAAVAAVAIVGLVVGTIAWLARLAPHPGAEDRSQASTAVETPGAPPPDKEKPPAPARPGASPGEVTPGETPPEQQPEDQPTLEKPKKKPKRKKPAEEPKPEETVEPPAPAEPPEPPSPPEPMKKPKPGPGKGRGPFRDLLASVDLPPIAAKSEPGTQASEPIELGRVHLRPGDLPQVLDIRLLGGKEGLKGKQMFDLKRDEAAEASWRIRVAAEDAPAGDPAANDVARVWLDNQTLKLAWCEFPAADRARVGYLRNCGLAISAGGPPRWLPLSTAKLVEPIALDFDRGPIRVPLAIESAPEPTTLRLHVLGLAGEVPKYKIKPRNTIEPLDKNDPSKGLMAITLSPPGLPEIELRLAFDVKGHAARIEIAPWFQDQNGWWPFEAKKVAALLEGAKAAQQRWEAMAKNKNAPNRGEAAEKAKAAKAVAQGLQSLSDCFQSLRKGAKINYRVFTMVDDTHRVGLFTTTRATDAKPPAEGPPAR